VAKQSNEQSGCEGTVTDFKARKYIIRYKDGTTATLTKTALMKVLTPVPDEATATARTVGQIAADSAFEAVAAPMLAAQEAIRVPTTKGDAMVTDKLAAGCAAATTEQQPTTGDEPAAAVAIDEEEVNDSAIAHKLHLVLNCRSRRANKTLEGPEGW
jgi:hypothetical protein